MNRVEELIQQLCPNGVEWKKLGEVCEILDSQRRPVEKTKRSIGKYPYYGANGIQDYVDDFLFNGTFLLVGEDGSVINKDNSPILNWATGKIWVNNHAHILSERKEIMSLRFLYFVLSVKDISKLVRGVPPKLNQVNLRNIEIPIPPLPIQQEIVRILDTFTELTANLQTELDARKKQYAYYRDCLLNFEGVDGVEWKKLGEIGDVCMCKRIFAEQTSKEGDIPFYKIGTFGGVADTFIPYDLYEEYRNKYSFPKPGDILISAAGTIGKIIQYDGTDAYFQDSNIVWIDNDENLVLNRFLFYLYKIIKWQTDGGIIKRLYNDNIKRTLIPIPPFPEQRRIVAILDHFETLVNDLSVGLPAELEARRKQYEYYRDKLLTFDRV